MRILLIATRQIGDVLLTTPLLRSVRRAYPDAMIDVLVYAHTDGILRGNPDYNTLLTVAEHPNFREHLTLGKYLFRHYDFAISTLSGDKPLLYALLAAPQRVAIVPPRRWQDAWKRLFVQAWTELDNWHTHTVIQNLRLADLLGIPRHYEVVLPQLPESSTLPFSGQYQTFAVLHLAPMWHYKRWTLAGWEQLAKYLIKKGLQVVLTGGHSAEELAYISTALEIMPPTVVNLAGQLRFSEVAALIRASKLYVGPDTAVTHVAAATGVPTIALYGPTNPVKWAPWPYGYASDKSPFDKIGPLQRVNNVVLIQGTDECVPCHLEGCDRHRYSNSRCLTELDSSTVIGAVQQFI